METPKSTDPQIPSKIDRYDLLERIGAGGMGTIYKGFDTKLKRQVAIKIISDRVKDASVRATIRERFFNEARAAGGLSHPNLVQTYDFNEQDGIAYIVMEYIEGETLDELIKSKGPLNNEDMIRIGKELASALAFAHKKGIVHRDIKPSNIIIEASSGLAKILDFGIAKFVNEDEMKLTSTGMVLGSTHYLSPEHIVGKNLDGRSDIFCLGTLMYEACTAILPFRGQNSSTILYKIVHFDPQNPSEIRTGLNTQLSQVIMKCLKKSPTERFQRGEDLEKELADLQSALRGDRRAVTGGQRTTAAVAKSFFVRDSQILSALQAQKKLTTTQVSGLRGKSAIDVILREEMVSEDELSKAIAECLSLPWIPKGRLRALRVGQDALDCLSLETIQKYNILPFFRDEQKKVLSFVIDGSLDFQKDESIAELVGTYSLQFYIGGRNTLQRLIENRLQQKHSGPIEQAAYGETGGHTLADTFEDRRILLIDSTPQNQEAVIKLFKGRENNLVICPSVDEAVLKLRRESFDYVWAHRSFIGDELQFEQLILRQNPTSDIRYYENLGQELFQETVNYRRFREFFNRITQMYLAPQPKELKAQALALASLAVKVARGITQVTRQLDEVYFAALFWKLDKGTNLPNKGFELFDGIYRFRYIADCLGERFDGRGALGLRDDQIPLPCRVIAALMPVEQLKQKFDSSWSDQEVSELKAKFTQYAAKQLDPRLTGNILDLLHPSRREHQKSGRVMIVDSDAHYAQSLAAQLKSIAAETTIYADGLSALAAIKKEKPDLVISEVLLSKLDGFSLCARLQSDENLKNIPLVFLSDSTAPEHSSKALQLGAEDFLLKNSDSEYLMTKFERMLKKIAS